MLDPPRTPGDKESRPRNLSALRDQNAQEKRNHLEREEEEGGEKEPEERHARGVGSRTWREERSQRGGTCETWEVAPSDGEEKEERSRGAARTRRGKSHPRRRRDG
jgi:hypothetical protein